jgi:LmbE family N-acetylglucosaminyl deacetylase
MKPISRRKMLGEASGLAAAFAVGLPLGGDVSGQGKAGIRRLKVVVAGAHPDDPETGCAGTIARYTELEHEVVVIYLTRGEAGIEGKSHEEAARIRTQEAQRACEILKARPVFVGQIDGATEINAARYEDFRKILEAEHADLLFTHWPLDSHRDHRVISLLVYDAWLYGGRKFPLYYFEVDAGEQTSQFHPDHYVDITATEPQKRAACYAHASQNPDGFYKDYHDPMNRFRGLECGCKFAEAFVRHVQSLPQAPPLLS